MSEPRAPAVGIDLGTTNTALAWIEPGAARLRPQTFDVPQLVASGEVAPRPTLPSFLYLPTDSERASGSLALPWRPNPHLVVGTFARDHGALVPSRQIASAKSWLANASVDRTAPLLPLAAAPSHKLSPVAASAQILTHLRDGWNHHWASEGDALRLERQAIVITVPASFDEEARELTVQAARDAGLERLTLLEEPLAALYAWIAAHGREERRAIGDGLVLMCDVGGGTTDFSLVQVSIDRGEPHFERVAIGEHLLLGGDNLDLALAAVVERKLADADGGARRLTLTQREALRRHCSAAKERLLSDPGLDDVAVAVLGAGSGLVAGTSTTALTRDEVVAALHEFLPVVPPHAAIDRERRVGLRELGLPYETDPAITKHLARFLTRAAGRGGAAGLARPQAVLFNGGFFSPPLARERVLDTLESWFGERPRVLSNERPETAVAMGAACYARLRDGDQALARRLLIRAGSARAYYIGVQHDGSPQAPAAVCVLPRGTQEGSRVALERELTVTANEPAAFTLFSATERDDPLGALVTIADAEVFHRHAPLVTALRFGKRSRRVPLAVGLVTVFNEVGTLELWCESKTTEHRWRLQFNLRAAETAAGADEEGGDDNLDQVLVDDQALAAAERRLEGVFGAASETARVDGITGELENLLGHAKQAWPLTAIRRLADVLLHHAGGRQQSERHEARWLNLTGFCMRPGFGTALDPWRVAEIRKVYAAGLVHARDVQCQVEWIVLWQRVAPGFTASQQRELAQRSIGALGLGARKAPRLNSQVMRETWRLLAVLERLDAGQRARLGDQLLERVRREPANPALAWALGRLGARSPAYGPLNAVVAAPIAERWLETLLTVRLTTPELAAAIAQIGARTGDAARDVHEELRSRLVGHLEGQEVPAEVVTMLREITPVGRTDLGKALGESLPEGLRIE